MFKTALTKAKFPLDGKIDFTTPKNAPKKVRKSSPRKRKISYSTAESADSDTVESDLEVEIKKSGGGKKKNTSAKRAQMKDQGCQTSPGFVAAAKAARTKAKKAKPGENPEMEQFAKKAVSAAKKATAKKSISPSNKKAKKESENNGDLSNPTPAMLALMAKKAEKPTPKKRSSTARK